MSFFKKHYCKIVFRQDDKFSWGDEWKSRLEALEGTQWWFTKGWEISAERTPVYGGEIAMVPIDGQGWPEDGPKWIAAGDLEVLPNPEENKA